MLTMKSGAALAAILTLTGCVEQKGVVSSFNGDSVALQEPNLFGTTAPNALTDAEAERICQRGGKQRAEYASTRALPNYVVEHLYLCLD